MALLVASCGDPPAPPAPPAAATREGTAAPPPAPPVADAPTAEPRYRTIELAEPRHAEVALLVQGEAQVAWFARGKGTLTVTLELDDGSRATESVELTGEARTPAVHPLPGRGARALRLLATAPAGVAFESLRVKDEGEALPSAGALAGALRGRSLAIVLCDALHAAHLSCYGSANATSPEIDQLAQQGVRAAQLRSQTSWTIPSVATLFTGVEQETHGIRDVGHVLDPELPTLAERFRDAGYRTAAFLQNKLVTREAGLARGFESWNEYPGESRGLLLPELAKFLAQPPPNDARPLFLYVHLLPPHAPYAPPADFAGRFGAPQGPADGSVEFLGRLAQRSPHANDPHVQTMRALYDNHVAYGDALLGETARLFFARGREQSALLFTSDHGEAFGQHDAVGHNMQVHDEMVHVPFVLVAPNSPLPAGRVVDAPLWMPDLLPTVAELFALPAADDPDTPAPGRSFAGLLAVDAASAAPRAQRLSARWLKGNAAQRAIVWGRFKLVAPAGRRIAALYDLAADPHEQNDVSAAHPLVAAALRAELANWVAQGVRSAAAEGFAPDAALQRELEALGYTGDH